MPALDPIAIDALHALGAARTPEAGAAERAWLQMQQRIVDGPPPIELLPAATATDRTRWIAAGVVVTALAAAIVLAIAWRPRPLTGTDDSAPAVAPYSTAPAPAQDVEQVPVPKASSAVVTPEPADEAAATIVESEPRPRATKPTRRTDAAPASSVSPSDPVPVVEPKTTTLAAEMRLLARANTAMRAGNPAQALATLDEHARTFAAGQLAPERDYQRAVALCELGRKDAARKVVAAFARSHPKSPLRSKAEGVCKD